MYSTYTNYHSSSSDSKYDFHITSSFKLVVMLSQSIRPSTICLDFRFSGNSSNLISKNMMHLTFSIVLSTLLFYVLFIAAVFTDCFDQQGDYVSTSSFRIQRISVNVTCSNFNINNTCPLKTGGVVNESFTLNIIIDSLKDVFEVINAAIDSQFAESVTEIVQDIIYQISISHKYNLALM